MAQQTTASLTHYLLSQSPLLWTKPVQQLRSKWSLNDSKQKYLRLIGWSVNDSDNSDDSEKAVYTSWVSAGVFEINSDNSNNSGEFLNGEASFVSFGNSFENNSAMFRDYSDAVLKAYHELVASKEISLNLSPLTPGNVRNECRAICIKQIRRQDERLLNVFFGYEENKSGYIKAIDHCDIDKFRPMINFVEGRSKDPDPKHVELLAWLIGFQHRPFDDNGPYGKTVQIDENEGSPVGAVEDIVPSEEEEGSPSIEVTGLAKSTEPQKSGGNPTKWGTRNKQLVITLVITFFISTLGYLSLENLMSQTYVRNNKPQTDSSVRSLRDTNTAVAQTDSLKKMSTQLKVPHFGLYGQCQAPTKKKTRCLRSAKASGFCWQHEKTRGIK